MVSLPHRILQGAWPIASLILLAAARIEAADPVNPASSPDTLSDVSGGARIECVTPDGQSSPLTKQPDPGVTALIMDDGTVNCLLQEGETDFVVEMPRKRLIDRLTFLNENARARGELKIAVSNERLKADSADWVEVEGIVPFSHKRLFGVSLIGIEARFVRLSFRVEKPGMVTAFTPALEEPAADKTVALEPEKSFTLSALQDAIDSKFATLHGRESVLVTAKDASVGPLSAAGR